MRHDQLKCRDDFDVVEIATNDWPASAAIAEMELSRNIGSENAAPDLPPTVGWLIGGAYVALIAYWQ